MPCVLQQLGFFIVIPCHGDSYWSIQGILDGSITNLTIGMLVELGFLLRSTPLLKMSSYNNTLRIRVKLTKDQLKYFPLYQL